MRVIGAERAHQLDVLRFPGTHLFIGHRPDAYLDTEAITLDNRTPFVIAIAFVVRAVFAPLPYVETTRNFLKRPVFVAVVHGLN